MASLIERLARSERWPRHRLYASQLAELRTLLVHSIMHSPLHRERLGLSPDAVARIEWPAWRSLPTLARATLQRHIDASNAYALAEHAAAHDARLPSLREVRVFGELPRPDGSRHWPSFPASVWLPSPAIRRVQLVQTALDTVEVRMEAERDLDAAECHRLLRSLRERLGWPHELRLCRVDSLRAAGSHKLEDFVSLVPHA